MGQHSVPELKSSLLCIFELLCFKKGGIFRVQSMHQSPLQKLLNYCHSANVQYSDKGTPCSDSRKLTVHSRVYVKSCKRYCIPSVVLRPVLSLCLFVALSSYTVFVATHNGHGSRNDPTALRQRKIRSAARADSSIGAIKSLHHRPLSKVMLI